MGLALCEMVTPPPGLPDPAVFYPAPGFLKIGTPPPVSTRGRSLLFRWWGKGEGGAPDRYRLQRVPRCQVRSSSYDNRTRNQGPHSANRIGTAALPRPGMSALCGPGRVPPPSAPATDVSPRRPAVRASFSLVDFAVQVRELPANVHRLSALSPCVTNNLSAPRCSTGRRTFWAPPSRIAKPSASTGGPLFMTIGRSTRWRPEGPRWRTAHFGDGSLGWDS